MSPLILFASFTAPSVFSSSALTFSCKSINQLSTSSGFLKHALIQLELVPARNNIFTLEGRADVVNKLWRVIVGAAIRAELVLPAIGGLVDDFAIRLLVLVPRYV